jgi:2-octaprenyl-6-methoxyphenol hydroxylase
VALLGDAAHAIHPLAGLGLNLGFKDAAALADCLAQALARGEDLGSPSVLERYQAMRRFETLATSWAMDGLNMLFVNGNPLFYALRDMGMKALDKIPQAKSVILAEASGLSQNNPRLMQGLLPG